MKFAYWVLFVCLIVIALAAGMAKGYSNRPYSTYVEIVGGREYVIVTSPNGIGICQR